MSLEVFLDDGPGEVRGVVVKDGRFEHLLISRDDDIAPHRLGARSIGRVIESSAGLRGAFVDLGVDAPPAFLPLRKSDQLTGGAKIEVEVTAEPRERKGATLKLIGAGEGAPRLLQAGPTVAASLALLAPGVEPVTGRDAIQASRDAEEALGWPGEVFPATGLDVMVERTRAMIAVDLDLSASAAGGVKARDRANRQGLREAARIMRFKRWAGLTAIDLIGVGHDGAAMLAAAREAFGADPGIVYGPLNRFGVLQLALPWGRTPLDEVFNGPDRRRKPAHRAQDIVRSLNFSLLSDTTTPRVVARCAPEDAAIAGPLVARLGPRAQLKADPGVAPGKFILDEG